MGDVLERHVVDRFGPGRENFTVPSHSEMAAFRQVVAHARHARSSDDVEHVRREAASLGYRLDCLQSDGNEYLVLHEDSRGWGSVIVDPRSSSPVVVEVPHPGFELGTPELGWRAFKAFGAGALVVAGATRGNRREPSPDVPQPHERRAPAGYDPWRHSEGVPDYSISDPTHARDTMFQAAHQALAGQDACVLQLHGFSARKHHGENPAFPADEQVVLSDAADDQRDPPRLVATQEALERARFRSHIVSFADDAGSRLGAVANVQHQDMVDRGVLSPGKPAEFVHMEVDTSLRRAHDRDAVYDHLVEALRPVFSPYLSPSP